MKENDKTTFKEFPSLIAKGFLMGAADVVPGVSGGTMALILGIYQRLLTAIKSIDTQAIKLLLSFKLSNFLAVFHWKFLLALLSGIGMAIIFFTRVIPLQVLMFSHPEPIYGLYFGLILGSIILLVKNLKQLETSTLVFIVFGTLFGWWVVNLVPTQTPESYLFIFGSGALAISAMILPGISGSFILLILGKYQFILSQISKIGSDETVSAILILAVFAFGMLSGIVVFSRFLSWLLERFYRPTLSVLIGFLIGSLSVIWPYQVRSYEEIVKTEHILKTDSKWAEIEKEAGNEDLPEFYRILPSENPIEPITGQHVQVQKVKKKLIKSEPFLPSLSNSNTDSRLKDGQFSLLFGFISIVVGLFSVLGIQKLADIGEK
jgi:putative membrane protein